MTEHAQEVEALPELPTGVYRHYKNHYYLVFGYGHDANVDGRVVVQYIGLELTDAHLVPRLSSRTAASNDPIEDAWWDFVHMDGTKCVHHSGDGCCSDNQRTFPRFEYVGPTWQG